MRTAINPITARMVQIIFGHLLLSILESLVPGGVVSHTSRRQNSEEEVGSQHSLLAWMQLWIIFFRAVWLHALKKSACIV
jgi:hypothetical protein